jgi:hypothetical protein
MPVGVEVAKPRCQPLTHVAVMDWWPLYPPIRPEIRQRRDFLARLTSIKPLNSIN